VQGLGLEDLARSMQREKESLEAPPGQQSAVQGARATVLKDMCAALRKPGTEFAEEAYSAGALPLLLGALKDLPSESLSGGGAGDAVRISSGCGEALWFMLDDSERCYDFASRDGNRELTRLMCAAVSDSKVASTTMLQLVRVLAQTVYSESRKGSLWDEDAQFLFDALKIALESPPASDMASAAIPLCDVCTLWLQRAGERAAGLKSALFTLVEKLVDRMAESTDDTLMLQHGCRLVCAIAQGTEPVWPMELVGKAGSFIAHIQSIHSMPDGNIDVKDFAYAALKKLAARRDMAKT